MMTIKQLKANLLLAICRGNADYVMWFVDKHGTRFNIDKVYSHKEEDIEIYVLESNETDHKSLSAIELLAEIDHFDDEKFVICINIDKDRSFEINDKCGGYDYNFLWAKNKDYGLYLWVTEV